MHLGILGNFRWKIILCSCALPRKHIILSLHSYAACVSVYYPQSSFICCVIPFGLFASLSPLYQAVSWFPRQSDVTPSDCGMDEACRCSRQQPGWHSRFSTESNVHPAGIRHPQRAVISNAVHTNRVSWTERNTLKTLLLILRWDTGKVRDRFGGMGRFKGGLRCKGWLNSVITEINYRYNYI